MKKVFTWTKNITPKMIAVWAVSFVFLLAVIFGSISLGLGLKSVTYGAVIDDKAVMYIEYRNDINTEIYNRNDKQLHRWDEPLHSAPMHEILSRLERGGKTNKLANLFRSNPKQEVLNNTMDNRFTSTFTSNYSNNSIRIYFATPQYNIESTGSRTQFNLTTTASANSDQVHEILIPLDRTQNRFQEQTWYLVTYDSNKYPPGQSLTIVNKITTYGNYHKLGKYVRELDVRF